MVKMKRLLKSMGLCVACVMSASVHAEPTGLLDGRSAIPEKVGVKSLEVGYLDGDASSNIGGRFNYQYSSSIGLYADYILIDDDFTGSDGDSIGIGVRYALANQRFVPSLDAAIRGSYHIQTIDFDSGSELEVTELSIALHLSSQQPLISNWQWYAVASYHRFDIELSGGLGFGFEDDDTEIGFGGGLFAPFGGGEAYIGLENVDETSIGLGYRHFLGGRG